MKKLNLDSSDFIEHFQVFGINSNLKDYQLCFLINEFFCIETQLLKTDFLKGDFSIYGDIIDEHKILIIQNTSSNNQTLIEKLKPFDYLIIVSNAEKEIKQWVKTFEQKDEILYIINVHFELLNTKDIKVLNQLLSLIQ